MVCHVENYLLGDASDLPETHNASKISVPERQRRRVRQQSLVKLLRSPADEYPLD